MNVVQSENFSHKYVRTKTQHRLRSHRVKQRERERKWGKPSNELKWATIERRERENEEKVNVIKSQSFVVSYEVQKPMKMPTKKKNNNKQQPKMAKVMTIFSVVGKRKETKTRKTSKTTIANRKSIVCLRPVLPRRKSLKICISNFGEYFSCQFCICRLHNFLLHFDLSLFQVFFQLFTCLSSCRSSSIVRRKRKYILIVAFNMHFTGQTKREN